MTTDPIERAMAGDEDLVPSSGFSAAVMDLVRREAAAPPPIPFPWRSLVLPIAAPGAVAVVMMWSGLARTLVTPVADAAAKAIARTASSPLDLRDWTGALWTAGALALSYVSWKVAARLAWPRA